MRFLLFCVDVCRCGGVDAACLLCFPDTPRAQEEGISETIATKIAFDDAVMPESFSKWRLLQVFLATSDVCCRRKKRNLGGVVCCFNYIWWCFYFQKTIFRLHHVAKKALHERNNAFTSISFLPIARRGKGSRKIKNTV